jgi:NAD(P)-dependent dehydrogenase (short-subunit alcohol dehydrogenase family)
MTAPMKTVLITGAAQGVGLATAALLTQRAYRG